MDVNDESCIVSDETQAFDQDQTPTYDTAFPALCSQHRSVYPTWNDDAKQPKFQTFSSRTTQVFTVPVKDRQYHQYNDQQFGDENELKKICKEITQRFSVTIEMSFSKDDSLTVVISGQSHNVMEAKRKVISKLQTQVEACLNIPREHHAFVLGKGGKKLQELQSKTATKISIPRLDEDSSTIKILGTREGILKAQHVIEVISNKRAKLASERLEIPKDYHPFICGPYNQFIQQLTDKYDVRINVPPLSMNTDEIVVSGEKDGVEKCKQIIMDIYEDKEKSVLSTVSVEVKKSQHRYLVGTHSNGLHEFFQKTDVWIKVPPADVPSETITLFGAQDKLGAALTVLYSKAHSMVVSEVNVASWFHRHVIGKKGANIRQLAEEYPKVHIEFTEDKVMLEGCPEEVLQAEDSLKQIVADVQSRVDMAEMEIDPKFYKHIIGKGGANIMKIKNETGVFVRLPSADEHSNVVRLEGSPSAVKEVKEELTRMLERKENEKTRDIIIEQRFHGNIIGARGEKVQEIRSMFNQVQISFPDPGKMSDIVMLRGSKQDVDLCFTHLMKVHKELVENNYQVHIRIAKDLHRNIIGKGGANIKKIREEADVRIDLPGESSDSDVITITGRNVDVETAREKIEDLQRSLANTRQTSVEIPHDMHTSIIGPKGSSIQSIIDECGGVSVHFPPGHSSSNVVTLHGSKESVEMAQKRLADVVHEKKECSFKEEIRARRQHVKSLIGRGGCNIRKLRQEMGVQVFFPGENDLDQELITIVGRESDVKKARLELEKAIKDLDNLIQLHIDVPMKYHRHFVARRFEVIHGIMDEYSGVNISFPPNGVDSEQVVLKGPEEHVKAARKKMTDIVADLEAMVAMECVIPQKFHGSMMGPAGSNVKHISSLHSVRIKFPDRAVPNLRIHDEEPLTNGIDGDVPFGKDETNPSDIIIISGRADQCEDAKKALQALVPVHRDVSVPFEYHRLIIGSNGSYVRSMKRDLQVVLSVPPPEMQSDVVEVTGLSDNVEQATQALLERVQQLRADEEDRTLRSYQLKVEVDPEYYPKIIGPKGATIKGICSDVDVFVRFPDRSEPNLDVITITGYEKDTFKARDRILEIVKSLMGRIGEFINIDPAIHSRIIGAKGWNVRKLMSDYNVGIKFPRDDAEDPSLVIVTGQPEDVEECCDYLFILQEEHKQDMLDKENLQRLQKPRSRDLDSKSQTVVDGRGFVVRDAPWDAAPNTDSTEEFPSIGSSARDAPQQMWPTMRKK